MSVGVDELALALEQQAIAGRIVTPVRDVYRKVRMLCSGDPRATFGLGHLLPASPDEIIAALDTLTGVPLPPEGSGRDKCTVDPKALVGQAQAWAERLRQACEGRQRVLFGTGHPAGPIDLYGRLAAEMAERGARVLRFAEAEPFAADDYGGRVQVRYVRDVACLSGGGELLHTHSPRPMEYLLDTGPMPDLVVGDHGFAGAGLARGADAVAMVDTNDPALILAWSRGLPVRPFVCDDNRPPSAYAPLADFLVARL